MNADDKRHGTYAGANAHWVSGTAICDPCRAAATRYHKARKLARLAGKESFVPLVGTRRRLRALAHLGYGFADIGRRIDCPRERIRWWASGAADDLLVTNQVAGRIADLYELLSMTVPTPVTQSEKRSFTLARNLARREGWMPPLAWDDIDMDLNRDEEYFILNHIRNEVISKDPHSDNKIDGVLVDRALEGDLLALHNANKVERRAITSRWTSTGRSYADLARLSGWNVDRYKASTDRVDAA